MDKDSSLPFSGLYKHLTPSEAEEYLIRIGYTERIRQDTDTVASLMEHQLSSVPFEDLDVFHGHIEPSLDTESLFDKIVRRRRGGYCFELNGLFGELLCALGFECHCRAAKIALGKEYAPPSAHRIIVVSICGKEHFCDVGFGGPVPSSPIPLVMDEPLFSSEGREYIFRERERDIWLYLRREGEFIPLLIFGKEASDPVEFIPLNAFCACSRFEPFRKKQMVWRKTPYGRCSLDKDILRLCDGEGQHKIRLETEDDLRGALKEHFGIVYDGEIRDFH